MTYRILSRKILDHRPHDWVDQTRIITGPWRPAGRHQNKEEAIRLAASLAIPGEIQTKVVLQSRKVWMSYSAPAWEAPLRDRVLALFRERGENPRHPEDVDPAYRVPRSEVLSLIRELGGEPPHQTDDWWIHFTEWYAGICRKYKILRGSHA